MQIELLAHNQQTYENMLKMIAKGDKRIGVVQPTGTGKSYLVAKLIQDMPHLRTLVLSPSVYINRQINKLCGLNPAITYMTYAKLLYLTETEWSDMGYDLIVLDEFHRCGAPLWGKELAKLLDRNITCLVIGVSATPVRYLDQQKDMAEILFGGNLAVHMTLLEAMVGQILPIPTYIATYYSFSGRMGKLAKKINQSKWSKKEKAELVKQLAKAKRHLEESHGIPAVLEKHFDLAAPKTIVFCKDYEHLATMRKQVREWFESAFKGVDLHIYTLLSEQGDKLNGDTLKAFEHDKEGVPILFTIDMLNEGVHIESVSNIFLLRPTESLVVLYQQIGRSLVAGSGIGPKIFDFVNNVYNVSAGAFHEELLEVFEHMKQVNQDVPLPEFKVFDEVAAVEKVFADLENGVVHGWELYYGYLLAYHTVNDNTDIPKRYLTDEGIRLGYWVHGQRKSYAEGILSQERIDLLNAIDFDFQIKAKDCMWDTTFQQLREFHAEKGHFFVKRSEDDRTLYYWLQKQRIAMADGTILPMRLKKLHAIGLEPTMEDSKFNYHVKIYQQAESEGVRLTQSQPHYDGVNLYRWVVKTRRLYDEGKLTPEMILKLENATFKLNDNREEDWNSNLSTLALWLEDNTLETITGTTCYGSCRIGKWYKRMQLQYKRGELSPERVVKFERLGISLTDRTVTRFETYWDNTFTQYTQFYTNQGTFTKEEQKGLREWINRQKKAQRQGELSPDRIARIEAVGVTWEQPYNTWEEVYGLLVRYQEEYGDCNVKGDYEGYNLHNWVCHQRQLYAKRKLSPEQIAQMEGVGFIWEPWIHEWKQKYQILKAYYVEHGHTQVKKDEEYQGVKIGVWVWGQRKRRRKGNITEQEIRLLDIIEMPW